MPVIVTQPLGRPPTFAELQALAGKHDVQITGDASAGSFHHPDPRQPKVQGDYAFDSNGDIHGKFSGQVLGKLAGSFMFTAGKAEIIINEKPFLLPEAVLQSTVAVVLKDFCAKFPAV